MSDHVRTLADLGLAAQNGREVRITGLSVDSRETKAGHLFAALPGSRVHGAEFVQYAVRMGAVAVLTDRDGARMLGDLGDVALVVAEEPRQALAYASALWFGATPGTVVAVTGTNGKTSVASFTRQIWMAMGLDAVNLGTTGVEGAWTTPLHHTTPEPITLHRVLAEASQAGITHVAMEASSHGLDQFRLDGVTLAAAGFSNFTQDHLDYHADFEEYFEAKAGLFDRVLPEDGVAVINSDDPKGAAMRAVAERRGQDVLTVGRAADAALRITGQRFDATGQELRFTWNGAARQVRLGLIGGFQADNVLLAAGLAIGAGADPRDVFDVLPMLDTVRGRMQLAATRNNGAAVFVDYAHTPAALETALQALRPHVMGRLIVVYGAGGDRDKGKRPLMGTAARDHADVRYVTDDNPRSEEPAAIRREILKSDDQAIEVADRAEAILRGVDALEPGDALLIAGKGHETGQTIGDTVYPFDDAEQASLAVAALDGRVV
ncbi:UDP-N-acetylmuramoyl-L-alanyl-D-glutamate--2, 6-diaminopimelate ligase [Rhodobacteraceae bacterium THAF1]|uniref:UDP-N-acetylmuramoyl-L-alanyl-D-glutamate--2, 6-diaminopimelate ligase n=1 Tax=Palleronia sp. THAF1 TaxID=2587842 RepID=UPI000F3DFEA1|nr:UDP-N-acetylmuramoyl-L-alanyl-D-glutamate--2,6-diaminopimelate ligase [Palleronia sp. THAF1]QFU09288.1 UDP-N-acetylmuramoyl-L-alanyl-D-glutamate--2,6-diaminopimelate ligase [Palleronia sp. THAF1]VDC26633.1 UDP-N-acetylmuramoyl-L-alanyl-D-glutamate--2, 6-diaminopimelate ligase [Rhodobacteraceae bacterium THAF1]